MDIFQEETDEFKVRAACYYTEKKVSVWFDGDKNRKQFFWGEGEQHRDEIEAIKAARAFVDGVVH